MDVAYAPTEPGTQPPLLFVEPSPELFGLDPLVLKRGRWWPGSDVKRGAQANDIDGRWN